MAVAGLGLPAYGMLAAGLIWLWVKNRVTPKLKLGN